MAKKTMDAADMSAAGLPLNPYDGEELTPDLEAELLEESKTKESPEAHLARVAVPVDFEGDDLTSAMLEAPIDVSKLPSWRGADCGIGAKLNDAIGGGLRRGTVLLIGAASAGGGKTAFAQQLVEGLALRSVSIAKGKALGPLTPVLVLSEMRSVDLRMRAMARWGGINSKIIANPMHKERLEHELQIARARAELAPIRDYLRTAELVPGMSAEVLALELTGLMREWCRVIEERHPDCEVWPVVLIDPIQRWQDAKKGEVEALNDLAERLGAMTRREGMILIATSDTNKQSATQEDDGNAPPSGILRGSYKLLHCVDAALVLRSIPSTIKAWPEAYESDASGAGVTRVDVAKSRLGDTWPNEPGKAWFAYQRWCGRFTPRGEPEDVEKPTNGATKAKAPKSRYEVGNP